MHIARAIYNYKNKPVDAYATLERYKNSADYYDALMYLNKMLMNDMNLRQKIADSQGIDTEAVKSPLA